MLTYTFAIVDLNWSQIMKKVALQEIICEIIDIRDNELPLLTEQICTIK